MQHLHDVISDLTAGHHDVISDLTAGHLHDAISDLTAGHHDVISDLTVASSSRNASSLIYIVTSSTRPPPPLPSAAELSLGEEDLGEASRALRTFYREDGAQLDLKQSY